MSGNVRNRDVTILGETVMTEDKSEFCDNSKTDSGFLSGGNLTYSSGELLVSGEIADFGEAEEKVEKKKLQQVESMRLDSGVDLNESFSNLRLQNPSLNDLSSKTALEAPSAQAAVPLSWEVLYEQDEYGDTYVNILLSGIRRLPRLSGNSN